MSISRKDLEYLAALARIELTPKELEQLAPELGQILDYVEKLKEADTESVPPTAHVLNPSHAVRKDQTQGSLSQEQALSNAPDREGPFFRVPRIIDAAS